MMATLSGSKVAVLSVEEETDNLWSGSTFEASAAQCPRRRHANADVLHGMWRKVSSRFHGLPLSFLLASVRPSLFQNWYTRLTTSGGCFTLHQAVVFLVPSPTMHS